MENKSAATTRKRKSMTNAQINIDGQIFNLVDIEPTGGRIKETSLTVEEICKRLESGAMCRDALLQRMENQWNKEKESHLILSALNERPLGAIIITGNGMAEGQLYEKQSLLDGLQRTTTLLRYTRNKFKLSKGLPPIVCRFRNDDGKSITKPIDISGMSFAQLQPLFQRRILDTKIDVNVYIISVRANRIVKLQISIAFMG